MFREGRVPAATAESFVGHWCAAYADSTVVDTALMSACIGDKNVCGKTPIQNTSTTSGDKAQNSRKFMSRTDDGGKAATPCP